MPCCSMEQFAGDCHIVAIAADIQETTQDRTVCLQLSRLLAAARPLYTCFFFFLSASLSRLFHFHVILFVRCPRSLWHYATLISSFNKRSSYRSMVVDSSYYSSNDAKGTNSSRGSRSEVSRVNIVYRGKQPAPVHPLRLCLRLAAAKQQLSISSWQAKFVPPASWIFNDILIQAWEKENCGVWIKSCILMNEWQVLVACVRKAQGPYPWTYK